MNMEELEIKNEEWQEEIRTIWDVVKDVAEFVYPSNSTEVFLTTIWNQSMDAFDKPREVQVIVDDNDELYISVGTPSFVSFENQTNQLKGMKLPIKCWIHTHPFGQAYWSGTDWATINKWRSTNEDGSYLNLMKSAIVLGDNQYMAHNLETDIAKKVYYGILKQYNGVEEE